MFTSFVAFLILQFPVRGLIELAHANSDGIYSLLVWIIVFGLIVAILTGLHLFSRLAGLSFLLILLQNSIIAHPNGATVVISIIIAILVMAIIKKKLNEKKKWSSKSGLTKWIFYLI